MIWLLIVKFNKATFYNFILKVFVVSFCISLGIEFQIVSSDTLIFDATLQPTCFIMRNMKVVFIKGKSRCSKGVLTCFKKISEK